MPSLQETIIQHPRIRRITVLISGSGTNLQALLDAANPTGHLQKARITHVLSSRKAAYGLTRARNSTPEIPTSILSLQSFLKSNPGASRQDYDLQLAKLVLESRPDLVVLAGFMHILSDGFLEVLEGRREVPGSAALGPPGVESLPTQTEAIPSATDSSSSNSGSSGDGLPQPPTRQSFPIPIINLHPALPGAFDGANAIGRAHEAFAKGEIEKTGVMVHKVVAEVDRGQPLVVREVIMRQGESLEELEGRIHEVEHEIIVEGARVVLDQLDKEGRI